MKILLGHCYYQSSAPSGEDAVYENEKALLLAHGIEVIPFELFNDDIDVSTLGKSVSQAFATTWSSSARRRLLRLLADTRVDIAHFHNTFPQMSSSVYSACREFSVPVVQTLHNYRLICASALLQRDNKPCEDCIGKWPLPALMHRCYRGSLAATGALALMQTTNRLLGNYNRLVDRYIALTQFSASRLVAGGLPTDKLTVKPNFLPEFDRPDTQRGNYALYAGRLSDEKGVKTLVEAWKSVALPLKVAGDGPLHRQLVDRTRELDLDIEFLGSVSRSDVLSLTAGAALQIVPSEWYEGFPMVILEAYASGTPVVASDIGSLSEIVLEGKTGWKFTPGDPDSLAAVVNTAASSPDILESVGRQARAHFDSNFTPSANFSHLMAIYNELL